jgi:phosphoribosylanthranilate isomerase
LGLQNLFRKFNLLTYLIEPQHVSYLNRLVTPHIKICCISSLAEADMAVRAGASAIGLVGEMPSGPGVIEDEKIKEIASSVPGGISTWLLTSETSADAVINHHQRVCTSAIQMVDLLRHGSYQQIRNALPGVDLIQVIHVVNEDSIDLAHSVSDHVDALLLDSGNPDLKVKELGGTGRVHNWEISKQIRERVNKPIFLAGGLTPENISSAVQKVSPYGVDICSGVQLNGKLNAEKLNRLVKAVKNSYP